MAGFFGGLFALLSFVTFVVTIVGLVSPRLVTKKGGEPASRKQLAIGGAFASVFLLALGAALAPGQTAPNRMPAPKSSDDPAQAINPAPELPKHNYSDRIKGVYYYVSAVSDNDKANGQASGEALGFKFLGTNDDGEYILALVNSTGVTAGRAYCHNPCSVVRYSSGQTAGFNPDSIIGAAFSDAFGGQLEEASKR